MTFEPSFNLLKIGANLAKKKKYVAESADSCIKSTVFNARLALFNA